MRHDVADDQHGGPAVDCVGKRRQIVERADDGLRIRPRAAREHADRRLRRAAGRQQAVADDGAAVMPI